MTLLSYLVPNFPSLGLLMAPQIRHLDGFEDVLYTNYLV